ncbi:hypothetical protein E2C01_001449 [Portunus trituberculatus]|uniref:Uncharacterized protein n=1 Tax=Portunus trituberculatus TaxID=210409 RepID=A0A5B7CMJ5_PORTR|nr:hypothetical protein [Portunus trituberculatus]
MVPSTGASLAKTVFRNMPHKPCEQVSRTSSGKVFPPPWTRRRGRSQGSRVGGLDTAHVLPQPRRSHLHHTCGSSPPRRNTPPSTSKSQVI